MTRLQMRQKILSFGDDYRVTDESGSERFFVDGKVFTLRNTLAVLDPSGTEVARIVRRMLAWGPTFEITRDGEVCAIVKKELFTFFRCRFHVDVPGPDDLEARGDFIEYEYEFTRHGRTVASVSKRFFALRDTYGIEFDEREDAVLLVAAAVVIDQCCHENDD